MRYIRFHARFPRRLTALVLALSVCLCLVSAASAADWSGVLNADRLLPAMLDFFKGTEGDYGSVNPNDNGALSVGILQWHGVRALRLVRRVIRDDPDAIWTLPASLRTEIRDENTTWNSRTLTGAEKTALSALLAAPSGVAAQDAQAREDLTAYIDLAWSAGMRSDATTLYWASILNQFGTGGAQTYLSRIRQTVGGDETTCFSSLVELHAAVCATSYGHRYLPTRERAYAFIEELGWSLTGQDAPEPPEPDEPPFTDLPPVGSWDREAIDFVLARGLLKGVSATRFAPADTMNRAMAVTVLWRLAGEPEPAGAPPFADVEAGAWYAVPVAWAAEQEIVRGTSADSFSPHDPVTREQFAAFLFRFARWSGAAEADGEALPEDGIPEALRPFPDAAEATPYARAAVAWAVETGLLRGERHGGALCLRPQKTATRSQAAALLMRYCVCFGTGD